MKHPLKAVLALSLALLLLPSPFGANRAHAVVPEESTFFATAFVDEGSTYNTRSDGDLWPSAWSDDGNLYLANGDGWGWTNQGWHDIVFNKITDGHPDTRNLSGNRVSVNMGQVWSGQKCMDGSPAYNRKPTGLTSRGGILWLAVQDLNRCPGPRFYGPTFNDAPNATILRSDDKGVTWTWDTSGPMFSNHTFTTIFFLDWGQDGVDNNPNTTWDDYIYAYGMDGNWRDSFGDTVPDPTKVYLARISAADDVQDLNNWQFWTGGLDGGEPSWSAPGDIAAKQPVLQDDRRVYSNVIFNFPNSDIKDMTPISQGSVTYNRALDRYIYLSWTEYTFEFYESPTPWGPWKRFLSKDFGPYTSPWKIGKNGGYATVMPSKYISSDGKRMWFNANSFEGPVNNYNFSLRQLYVTPHNPDLKPENEKSDTNNLAGTGESVTPIAGASFHQGNPWALNDGIIAGTDDWNGEKKEHSSWGYTWSRPYHLNKVVYTSGNTFLDGGYFSSDLKVQVRQNFEWVDVSDMKVSPDYPYDFTAKNQTFTFRFDDTWGDGVRIIGKAGGAARFTSISELEAYYSHDTTADVYASYSLEYDPDSGMLEGRLYTKYPEVVRVYAETEDGTVTEIPHRIGPTLYDDDNQAYTGLDFSDSAGSDIVKITVSGGQQQREWVRGDESGPYRIEYANESVKLDVYRMQGAEYFHTVTADTYMRPGQTIVGFTAAASVSDNVYGIEVAFPHREGGTNAGIGQLALNDWELVERGAGGSGSDSDSGSAIVPLRNMYPINEYTIVIETDTPLSPSREYELKLGGASNGDEVKMPKEGVYAAYVKIGTLESGGESANSPVHAENALYFRQVRIAGTGSPGGGDGGGSPGGGSSGGTVSSGSGQPEKELIPADPEAQVVTEHELKNGKDGVVRIAAAEGKTRMMLPADAADVLGENRLLFEFPGMQAQIPSLLLRELSVLIAADDAKEARIVFEAKPVAGKDAAALLSQVDRRTKAEVAMAGSLYELKLMIMTKDGVEKELDQFPYPITLALAIDKNADKPLAGLYYITASGELEYLGAEQRDGFLIAPVAHLGTLSVLEYHLEFPDVPSSHWAYRMLKEMAAKRFVEGAEAGMFEPNRAMTRAEFTALIARALELSAAGPAGFEDVPADAWYAKLVAAAHEAGIVEGRSDAEFAPGALISRQEMAAIIVRAYERRNGSVPPRYGGEASAFADRDVAGAWALPYIDAAARTGLVQGRGGDRFAPLAQMTRAEGTQIVYNLLTR
ncbi:hypothetical protein PAE9249_04313 [Paenibacillus sp. CECT 9249]|uniref:S-layer homology domain-containing protein n=1 Tax=Paenibacillus sp. CECT 9249 TaxID=2845385 RepID=UPI001E5F5D1C|nr:S-layer homology domain-containing protein [Paenibacillus sp. CECT 9249]CAH0121779.1 hypothetical protein PAE9249_04313 [Paenibacillus sp. CECT 9249]